MSALIGALRVTLGLDSAAFEKGASEIEKRSQKMSRTIEGYGKAMTSMGQTLSVAVTAPLAAISVAVLGLAKDAGKLRNAATLAGESFENFQRHAFAAKTVGIEFEKLGDILKDTQDKIGDFTANGGGEMADFFKNIAPKVGVTADMFRNLSGADALQLYYNSLEKAGVSQKELVFYMEAIADEGAGLIPLLKDNGKALKELGANAAVISDKDAEGLKRYTDAQTRLGLALDNLKIAIANSGLIEFATMATDKLSALANWFGNLSSPVQKFVIGIVAVSAAAGPLLLVLGQLTQGFSAFLAIVGVAGAAGGPLVAVRVALAGILGVMNPFVILIGATAGALVYLNQRLYSTQTSLESMASAGDKGAAQLLKLREEAREAAIAQNSTSYAANTLGQRLEYARQNANATTKALRALGLEAQWAAAQLAVTRFRQAQASYEKASANKLAEQASPMSAFYAARNLAFGDPLKVQKAARDEAARDVVLATRDLSKATVRVARNGFKPEIVVQGVRGGAGSSSSAGPIAAGASDRGNSEATRAAAAALGKDLKQVSEDLQPILDRLFPDKARWREYERNAEVLTGNQKAGKIDQATADEAMRRLSLEYYGLPFERDPVDVTTAIDTTALQSQVEKMTGFAWLAKDRVQTANVAIVKSFKDMADGTLGALQRVTDALKGGGFLDILGSVIGFGLQLGSIGAFGKGVQANLNRSGSIPGFANGTNFAPGGLAMVGERGPELVNLRRGSQVIPNHKLGGVTQVFHMRGNMMTPEFWRQVQGVGVMAADSGGRQGVARVKQASNWALR